MKTLLIIAYNESKCIIFLTLNIGRYKYKLGIGLKLPNGKKNVLQEISNV